MTENNISYRKGKARVPSSAGYPLELTEFETQWGL